MLRKTVGSGRGREIRTPDILLPKQARYQTALYPENIHLCGTAERGDHTALPKLGQFLSGIPLAINPRTGAALGDPSSR